MTGVHSNCKTILIDSECCDKTRYFVGMFDFPPTGEEKVLYVDESTGNVYIWDNDSDSYIGNAGTGSQGTQGTAGTPGIQGLQGIQGSLGLQGSVGETSAQGAQGGIGVTGAQGIQGIQGPQGILGVTGSQGTQGIQGLQGLQGIQGTQGRQGTQGLQGVQGRQGVQGANGFSCIKYTFQNTESYSILFIFVECDLATVTNYTLGSGQTYTTCISAYLQAGGGNVVITSSGLCSGAQGVQGIQGRQGTQGVQGTSIQGLQGIQGTSASLGCCCYAGLSIRELNPSDTVQNYKAVLTLFTECDLTGATVTWEVAPFIASYPYTTPPLAGPYVTNTIPLTGGNNLYLSLSDASGYWRVKIEKPGCCTIYSNPVYR